MATFLDRIRRHWIVGLLGVLALIGSSSFATGGAQPGPGALVTHSEARVDLDAMPIPLPTPTPTSQSRAEPSPVTTPHDEPSPEPAPVTSPTPAPVPDEVDLARPDAIVRPERRAPDLGDAMKVKGVDHLAATSEFTVDVTGADGDPVSIDVLAVSPETFRPLTPSVTAQAPAVWQRLREGDVVLRHDIANELGTELGSDVEMRSEAGMAPVRVGAFASNGAPPLADALVGWEVADQLGEPGATTIVLDVADGRDADEVAAKVLDTMGPGEVELRRAPETEKATADDGGRSGFEMLATSTSGSIEPFSYTDLGDGMIVIDPDWVGRWIASVEIPGFGTTRCHRVMIPQLLGALEELQERGLYHHLRPNDFGDCHVPRHIDFDPGDPLSMHAWGLAIDFNVSTNGLGDASPEMDPRVVEVFERWGFAWGGWWSRPDGMHFELDRVLTR